MLLSFNVSPNNAITAILNDSKIAKNRIISDFTAGNTLEPLSLKITNDCPDSQNQANVLRPNPQANSTQEQCTPTQ